MNMVNENNNEIAIELVKFMLGMLDTKVLRKIYTNDGAWWKPTICGVEYDIRFGETTMTINGVEMPKCEAGKKRADKVEVLKNVYDYILNEYGIDKEYAEKVYLDSFKSSVAKTITKAVAMKAEGKLV